MGFRFAPFALLLMLTLSGCAADESHTSDGSAASAPQPGEASSVPAQSRSPSSASQPSSSASRPSSASAAPAAPSGGPIDPDPVVLSCDVGTLAGAGLGGSPLLAVFITFGCEPGVPESRDGRPFRSAVVEMAWSNAVPTVVEAGFAVFDSDGEQLDHVEGPGSPLRLVLSGDSFPEGPSPELTGVFGGTGIFAQFEATFTFSFFETPEPPAGA